LRDTSRYVLTVDEASVRFAEAGVPRSPRTIQRYCKLGVLESVLIDTATNAQYLIDSDSLDRRIIELQQVVQSAHDAPGRDMSGQVATGRDGSRHDTSASSKRQEEFTERIRDLESENENLRFDSRINRELANHMRNQNRELIVTLTDQGRTIGRLETELRALAAPQQDRPATEPAPAEEPPPEQAQAASSGHGAGEGDNRLRENETLS